MSEGKVVKRRKKVSKACVYCRRSHMVCDGKLPCSRCVKRNIGHLCCYDEPGSTDTACAEHSSEHGVGDAVQAGALADRSGSGTSGEPSSQPPPQQQHQFDIQPVPAHLAQVMPEHESAAESANTGNHNSNGGALPSSNLNHAVSNTSLGRISSLNQPLFLSEHIGSEFNSLNEFLTMLEDPMLIEPESSLPHNINEQIPSNGTNSAAATADQSHFRPQGLMNHDIHSDSHIQTNNNSDGNLAMLSNTSSSLQTTVQHNNSNNSAMSPSLITDDQQPTPKENFFLTAADPSTEINPEDRLKLVINAKLEAGLLKPYNYAKGYSRLQNFMDKYMNQSSKQRILKPLSIIRPAFRAIARSLKDVDLVLVEESFERMLLSYDRVFTSMSMPACLWRRTGEIYRGNKEFASLVDCKVEDLRDGKLAIYELMSEESAVNFWEKYGSIAFDKGQKAVLTSCNLRTRDGRHRRPCCFSFTIRRDRYNIPICIVGNFIPIS